MGFCWGRTPVFRGTVYLGSSAPKRNHFILSSAAENLGPGPPWIGAVHSTQNDEMENPPESRTSVHSPEGFPY